MSQDKWVAGLSRIRPEMAFLRTRSGVRLPEDSAEACLSVAPLGYGKVLGFSYLRRRRSRASSAQRRPQGTGRRVPNRVSSKEQD